MFKCCWDRSRGISQCQVLEKQTINIIIFFFLWKCLFLFPHFSMEWQTRFQRLDYYDTYIKTVSVFLLWFLHVFTVGCMWQQRVTIIITKIIGTMFIESDVLSSFFAYLLRVWNISLSVGHILYQSIRQVLKLDVTKKKDQLKFNINL